MVRILGVIFLSLVIAGCVTVVVPKYLGNDFSYKKEFNADFETTFAAAVKSLEDLGWRVSDTESTPVYKGSTDQDNLREYETLIFTEIKQRSLFVFSSYLTLNLYVRSISETTSEVEMRYLSITVFPPLFGQRRVDKNDGLARKIYNRINENLRQKRAAPVQ
jgi:hypothetical protein